MVSGQSGLSGLAVLRVVAPQQSAVAAAIAVIHRPGLGVGNVSEPTVKRNIVGGTHLVLVSD